MTMMPDPADSFASATPDPASVRGVSDPADARRPPSAVSHGVGLAGLVGLLIWFFIARHYGMDGPNAALTSTVACGAAMILWSIVVDRVHRNPSTGIDWSMPRRSRAEVFDTAIVKLTGLWATWVVIAIAYMILHYYWQGPYLFAMNVLMYSAIPLVILSIPYVLWLDGRMVEPRDGAWHLGQWLLGGDGVDTAMVWRHARAWLVKAFFLAFMLSVVPGNFGGLVKAQWVDVIASPFALATFSITFLYMIDVHFATVGYILTMRPLDAHIRTANPYGMGWVAALVCYPPFVLMNPGGILYYQGGTASWDVWMQGQPVLLSIWGLMLCILTGIYAWATVAFGLRFSNLTHRGIITHGPYAITRHPAYLSKNAFWWLSSLVILPWDGGIATALRNTLLLSIVSAIYYWRAKTEEKHLLADPDYRAYWEWAQAHALVPRLFSRLSGMNRPVIVLEPDPRAGPAT